MVDGQERNPSNQRRVAIWEESMTDARAGERSVRKASRRASASRCWCRATTRRPRSPRWSPISAPPCRRRPSTSTTTIRPTAPSRPRAPPARWCGGETHQGKGNVVRRMFADIDADIYVLVDGDATYDAPSAPTMIALLLEERLDMVVAARVARGGRGLSARPCDRQPAADRLRRHRVRRGVHRHAVRLSGVLAPLRQVFPGAVRRLRDRDRADRACARARAAGRGNPARRILRARRDRNPSSRPGATASASSAPSCKLYRSERPLRFFSSIGIALAIIVDRLRHPDRHHTSSSTGPCRGCRPRSSRWA